MGNSNSTNSTTIIFTSLIQAYLSSTQISQQIYTSNQIVQINSDNNYILESCQTAFPNFDDNYQQCVGTYLPKISNINSNMNIKVSFTDNQQTEITEKFINSFKSQFTQISKQYDQSIVSIDDNDANIVQSITNISNYLFTDSFFQSIEVSYDNSYIKLSNIDVKNVNLNMVVDGVYTAIQKNQDILNETSNLEILITQSNTAISETGFKQIITWIVYLILGVITLYILFYIFTIVFQIFTVYSTT